jgi:hypothetical protein
LEKSSSPVSVRQASRCSTLYLVESFGQEFDNPSPQVSIVGLHTDKIRAGVRAMHVTFQIVKRVHDVMMVQFVSVVPGGDLATAGCS